LALAEAFVPPKGVDRDANPTRASTHWNEDAANTHTLASLRLPCRTLHHRRNAHNARVTSCMALAMRGVVVIR
jgi:hypothetical protein